MPNYQAHPHDDPFVDMPAMPHEHGGRSPPMNPFGASAPLLQLQPPSPDLTQPPQLALLPPPVIRSAGDGSSPGYENSRGGETAAPFIPRWTPDSPSAAHPNLPPPPSYESPLTRTRTRSNEDPTAGGFASPFADTNSLHSLSSDGVSSPPRQRSDERKLGGFGHKARGFVVLNGSSPSFVEANLGLGSKVYASEDMASRRRRNQKLKWGGLSIGLCVALVLFIALAIGVGIGVVKAT